MNLCLEMSMERALEGPFDRQLETIAGRGCTSCLYDLLSVEQTCFHNPWFLCAHIVHFRDGNVYSVR